MELMCLQLHIARNALRRPASGGHRTADLHRPQRPRGDSKPRATASEAPAGVDHRGIAANRLRYSASVTLTCRMNALRKTSASENPQLAATCLGAKSPCSSRRRAVPTRTSSTQVAGVIPTATRNSLERRRGLKCMRQNKQGVDSIKHLLAAALACAANASQAEWFEVASNAQVATYIDSESVRMPAEKDLPRLATCVIHPSHPQQSPL